MALSQVAWSTPGGAGGVPFDDGAAPDGGGPAGGVPLGGGPPAWPSPGGAGTPLSLKH
jgi:hypothetical protein